MKDFFAFINFKDSIWLTLPFFLLLPGTNSLSFVFAICISIILIFLYGFHPSKYSLKIATALIIFAFFRIIFTKDFQNLANIKTSFGFIGFIFFALVISHLKNKLVFYSLLLFPFFFLLFSFLLTYYFEPNLLLERKILDTPMFLIIEWGPSFVFFNLAIISCSIYFLYSKKYFLYFCSLISLFIAIFYGVRTIIPLLFLSNMYFFYIFRINKSTLSAFAIQCTFLIFSHFSSPIFINHITMKVERAAAINIASPSNESIKTKINLPPIIRKWESPRLSMIKEVFTKDFIFSNFFGGKRTTFSHPDFVNNSHNYFVDVYWNHGFFAALSLLLALIFYFFSPSQNAFGGFIFLGHFFTLNLNLTPPWYLIIFFCFLIISHSFEDNDFNFLQKI